MTGAIYDTRQSTAIELDSDATAGEAVTAYLREQAGRLRAAETAVRTGEPDGVHDMRVAVRRLRSAIRVFRKVYRGPERERASGLRRELTWLSGALGRPRDAEVIHRRLSGEVDATPTELVLGPVSAELDRYLTRDAADSRADLLSALEGPRYASLLAVMDAFLATPPSSGRAGKPAADVLPKMLRKAHRRASKAMAAVDNVTGSARDTALHQVRKAVRRSRYAAEVAVPVLGRPAKRYARRARKVQRVLGDHHDYVVLRGTLRDLGVRSHLDGENSFTFGLLHGRLGMAAGQREREFPRRWRKLTTRKTRRWLNK
jgi:CHAD domain-containing protein